MLYVDDDDEACQSIGTVLKYYFNNVYIAKNGFEALEIYKGKSCNVLLVDYDMPMMNGFEFLKNLRASGSKTTVIINSNLSQNSEVKKSFELGANEYLRKSDYTVFKLVDKVKEIVEN